MVIVFGRPWMVIGFRLWVNRSDNNANLSHRIGVIKQNTTGVIHRRWWYHRLGVTTDTLVYCYICSVHGSDPCGDTKNFDNFSRTAAPSTSFRPLCDGVEIPIKHGSALGASAVLKSMLMFLSRNILCKIQHVIIILSMLSGNMLIGVLKMRQQLFNRPNAFSTVLLARLCR